MQARRTPLHTHAPSQVEVFNRTLVERLAELPVGKGKEAVSVMQYVTHV